MLCNRLHGHAQGNVKYGGLSRNLGSLLSLVFSFNSVGNGTRQLWGHVEIKAVVNIFYSVIVENIGLISTALLSLVFIPHKDAEIKNETDR